MRDLRIQNDTLKKLSSTNEKLVNEIKSKNIELKQANDQLEDKVKERTATLNNIFDNVKVVKIKIYL